MANKYDYLDELDDYLDNISDKAIRQGSSMMGKILPKKTDDQKEHLSKKLTGRKISQSKKDALYKANKGSIASDEKKKNISNSLSELWNDNDHKKRMIESRKSSYHTGNESRASKGSVIGTNTKTGEEIVLSGNIAMKNAGFNPALISECINGNRKSHKGYIWRRESIEK
jgi:hypothetical protein